MDGRPPLALRAGLQIQVTPIESRRGLAAEHRQLVSRLVRSFAKKARAVSSEDLRQEANIALWHASCKFDDKRGEAFSHYASVCIKNALQEYVNTERRLVALVTEPLAEGMEQADADGAEPQSGVSSASATHFFGSPSDGCAYQRCLMHEVAAFVSNLSPQLRTVYYEHVLAGRSQAEVADSLWVTQQRVARLKTELFGHVMVLLSDTD